jgi:glycerol-3-phosphate dehydrogenase
MPAILEHDWQSQRFCSAGKDNPLPAEVDILIAGGGITGAGIALEAARAGYRVLLAEQKDFAWGSSSRSSKLVHGGLRYLKEGQWKLTRDSVRERQRLMTEAPGLVQPQSFAFSHYRGKGPSRWLFALGLAIYDKMAGSHARHQYDQAEYQWLAPHIRAEGLDGGMCYLDAKTDDVRLVLRVLQEARKLGAVCRNYLKVQHLIYDGDQLCGAALCSADGGQTVEVRAKVVINACGAWSDQLRKVHPEAQKLRPLRGSHLLFPAWRLPVAQAVSLMHPDDGRPVFLYPWEGVTLVGTTDLDHAAPADQEPRISQQEVDYLMCALHWQFPSLALTTADVLSCYAGVRPVVDDGHADPSQVSRDHVLWQVNGLLTVTGGKLTTFRLIAREALNSVSAILPVARNAQAEEKLFTQVATLMPPNAGIAPDLWQRLCGYYGDAAQEILKLTSLTTTLFVPGTQILWAEMLWSAMHESVRHLDDLLLRRTRYGLILPRGGRDHLSVLRSLCQTALGWDDQHWEQEEQRYLMIWQEVYQLPAACLPDA